MSNVSGVIYAGNDFVGYVINRSTELDADMRRAGIDPDQLNYASTPLIGASRHAEVVVLAFMATSDVQPRPFDFGAQSVLAGGSADILYGVRLYEPQAGVGSGTSGPIKDPGRQVPVPDIIDTVPQQPQVPDFPDEMAPGSGFGDDVGPRAAVALRSASATAAAPIKAFQSGRQMWWTKLTLVEAKQVLASVASDSRIRMSPGNPGYGGSLFVLRFVDARMRFLGQTVWAGTTTNNTGTARDQWNMLAENPLHLVAATAKSSTYLPPAVSGPRYRGAGVMNTFIMRGIPAPSPWYEDECYTAEDIIAAYVGQSTLGQFGRSPITYRYSTQARSSERKGDMLNLDLRGKSIGQALDEVAARIGCVWAWDRYAATLELKPFDFGVPNGSVANYPLSLWEFFNAAFRCGGGFSVVTNDMPYRVASVHPVRYVSVYGRADESNMYVDWRSMATPDGVRSPTIQASGSPPLYYATPGSGTGRVHFFGDHVPAYYGMQGAENDLPISSTPPVAGWSIWNATVPGTRCNWWSKSWATSIANRRQDLSDRYLKAGILIDGEVILNRLPAYGEVGPMMSSAPCASLNCDEVRFGMGSEPLQYRLYGKKSDPLIFPHLLPADRVQGLGIGQTYSAHGCLNLQRFERRSGIVRTFLASFARLEILKSDPQSALPYVWLYAFTEVSPDNLASGSFRKGNEWGDEALAMEGRALNLCEMAPLDVGTVSATPDFNFDGGTLRYNPQANEVKIVRAAPSGIAPCYEYITPSGMTVFYLYAPPGVRVFCPGSTTALLGTGWQNSGASGSGFADDVPLSGIVGMVPTEVIEPPVGSEPGEPSEP